MNEIRYAAGLVRPGNLPRQAAVEAHAEMTTARTLLASRDQTALAQDKGWGGYMRMRSFRLSDRRRRNSASRRGDGRTVRFGKSRKITKILSPLL